MYADARIHFPPSAAAARVCQARMSPVASVWKGCEGVLGSAGLEFWWLWGEKGGEQVLEIGGGVREVGRGKGEREGEGRHTKLSIECLECFAS